MLCILVDLQVSVCLVPGKKRSKMRFPVARLKLFNSGTGSASRPLLYTDSAFAFSLTQDDPIYLREERGRIIRPAIRSVR